MSIFSECMIKLKSETICLISVSHNLINPSIAVCTSNKIMLYSDNGDKHDYELARNLQPTALDWHPSLPQLGIGWENGTITLWNDETKNAKEETQLHKDPVNLVMFNSSGMRMVTCDHKGLVVVWRGITPMCTYQKDGLMTHCIFADLNNMIKTNNLFFFGGKQGVVCLADDSKHCSDVCKVGGSIKSLLIYEKENSVIIITSSLLLVQFKISTTEKSAPDKKIKLTIAGDVDQLHSIWIGSCLLATTSYENMIRMWHLEQDENYVLTLHEIQEMAGETNVLNDKIACVAYDNKGKYLIAGTKEGRILFWRNMMMGSESPVESEQWRALPFIQLDKPIQGISVGRQNGLTAVRTQDTVKIIQETVIKGRMSDSVKVLQIDAQKVIIYIKNENQSQMFLFESKNIIKSLDCTDQYLMVQSSKKIEIHEIILNNKDPQIKLSSTIDEKCLKAAIHGENLIMVSDYNINVANFKGIVKQTLSFSESDGPIQSFQITGKTMVVWSLNNYLRLYDLGRREYRQLGVNRRFENADGLLGKLRLCNVNSDGSKVVIIADSVATSDKDKFYVYDLEMDNFTFFELEQCRKVVDVQWDVNDARYLVVVTEYSKSTNVLQDDDLQWKQMKLFTFFFTSQTGIRQQDEYNLEKQQEGLFGVRIPYLLLIVRNSQNQGQNFRVTDKLMNDFVGLEKADEATKKAVINFSFHLSSGNLDEAYKSVKSIQNPAVWEKMAQMSVKTRKLDVAEICIGNMKFARGSKAIRESKKEPELEAQLAMVAIQLGMISEAEKLYMSCKRYDLLNKMYQSCGDWKKALDIAEKHDRINLLFTYYKLGRTYEIAQEYDKSIEYYEKSGNYAREVPRMLLECGDLERLEEYVELKKDKQLYKWWANYLESQTQFDQSLKYYKLSEDYQSIIRILVYQGDLRQAKEICLDKNDPAASFYLAKQLELKEMIPEAINFYARAQYFSQAVKLAKERNMDTDVMSLSLQGPSQVMVSSAQYFEEKGLIEKAVILYMKGRQLKRAMKLAQSAKLVEYVKKINQEMVQLDQEEVSKKGVKQESNVRGQQQIYAQISGMSGEGDYGAIMTLIGSQQFEKALDLCISNNIAITQELVNKIVPLQVGEKTDDKKRKDLLLIIAEKCKKMGNFEMASKIYIQLGDRVKGVKALIKMNDSEKVIAFAKNARTPEIYILVGNYLQTGDWHKNPELMKHIIQFYNSAKAFDHLAGFFDACSTVEIDEYRDYEKACAALKEALKHANKSANEDKNVKIQFYKQLTQKLSIIEQFVEARSLYQTNPDEMLRICQQLLTNVIISLSKITFKPNVEYAIRAGDIHAQVVEYYYELNHLERAYQELITMQKKGIVLNPYLDQEIINTIMNAVGQKGNKQQPGKGKPQEQEDDDEAFQEEEVIDDNI